MPRKSPPDTDPDVVRTRGALGAALKYLNADDAAAAARALVEAKKADQIRRARELLADAGIKVDIS
jgi:hypothetical protein